MEESNLDHLQYCFSHAGLKQLLFSKSRYGWTAFSLKPVALGKNSQFTLPHFFSRYYCFLYMIKEIWLSSLNGPRPNLLGYYTLCITYIVLQNNIFVNFLISSYIWAAIVKLKLQETCQHFFVQLAYILWTKKSSIQILLLFFLMRKKKKFHLILFINIVWFGVP